MSNQLAPLQVVTTTPDWLYPSWSVHRRFRAGNANGTYEVYVGIHNSWRWESWSRDGSMHLMAEGYATEEAAVAASPCHDHPHLAYEELCKISFNPSYAWLIIDTKTGEFWGRTGFDGLAAAEENARAWLRAGHPEQPEVAV